jgi:hypothetical protein
MWARAASDQLAFIDPATAMKIPQISGLNHATHPRRSHRMAYELPGVASGAANTR